MKAESKQIKDSREKGKGTSGFQERNVETEIKKQTQTLTYTQIVHRVEQKEGKALGEREKVGWQETEGETDMEAKLAREPTPRKDKLFHLTAPSPACNSVLALRNCPASV